MTLRTCDDDDDDLVAGCVRPFQSDEAPGNVSAATVPRSRSSRRSPPKREGGAWQEIRRVTAHVASFPPPRNTTRTSGCNAAITPRTYTAVRHADAASREIAGPIMHFSPGKIQQRVRSAQRFSHLKCIEFITYSRPTGARVTPAFPPCPAARDPSIDNVFSHGGAPRMLTRFSFIDDARAETRGSKIKSRWKKKKEKNWRCALTARSVQRRVLVSGYIGFPFSPAGAENNGG